jgi:putative DNA primase/helicase
VTADPEDKGRRLFIPSKTNLGRDREGLAYRIADTTIMGGDGELIWAPFVQWEDTTITMSADEAVAAMGGDAESRGAKEDAKAFLLEVLAEGPVPARDVKRQAEEGGVSIASLRRAQRALSVEVRREGGIAAKGQWLWCLRCSPQRMNTLDTLGDFRRFSGDQTPKVLKTESEHLSAKRQLSRFASFPR